MQTSSQKPAQAFGHFIILNSIRNTGELLPVETENLTENAHTAMNQHHGSAYGWGHNKILDPQ